MSEPSTANGGIVKNLLVLFSAVVVVLGCATSTKMYGPDGKEYFFIACDGIATPMSVCYEKAMEVCQNGYYLAGQEKTVGPVQAAWTTQGGFAGQGMYKNITIACK